MDVLDAPAFIHGYQPDGDAVSVPAVREELEGSASYRFEAMAGGAMSVLVPSEDAIDRVMAASRDTGDAGVLSRADVRVLAAALEHEGRVVTDDYAVQNVASALELDVLTLAEDGIEEEREWRYQCQGCGRVYDEAGRCEVCGSETTRKNPAN